MMEVETIDELKELVLKEIKSKDESYDVVFKKTLKENEELTAVMIKMEGTNTFPTAYLERVMEAINQGMDTAEAVRQFVNALVNKVEIESPDLEFVMDYEKVKPKLSFRLINTERNLEFLNDKVHADTEYEGLTIVPVIIISSIKNTNGEILITKQLVDIWGVDEETIIADAKVMAPKNDPIKQYEFPTDESLIEIPFKIWTNASYSGGAKVILYPEFKAMLDEEYPNGVYIIPSSRHEILCLESLGEFGTENEIDNVLRIIKDVNDCCIRDADYLSDYLYGYKDGEFRSWK